MIIKKARHDGVGLSGFGGIRVIPEGMVEAVENYQLRPHYGTQKCAMECCRIAQKKVACAGYEEGRWHPM